ncbi:MAG: glycosyltransferase family 2 protein [Kiritimatiellales bacterium]|nr:glycosyltransferase family 2 protein [Kiritimatiellales bacterium]
MAILRESKKVEKYCVLICAYNEEAHIEEIVRSALSQSPCAVLVVDDGSKDRTAERAEKAGATVLKQPSNIGKGAALKRGFEFAMQRSCDALVVVDGDGQHNPAEIRRFLDAYERTKIPILIGNRMADTRNMPVTRKWTNRFMSRILNRLVKIYVADPPCGYRFYRTDVLPFIISDEKRFAFEFDILIHAALRGIRIDSVRISTIYAEKQRSHVAPLLDAILLLHAIYEHFPLFGRKTKGQKNGRE